MKFGTRLAGKDGALILNLAHLAAINIIKASNLMSLAVSRHLQEFGVTLSQHSVLAFVKANAPDGLPLNVLGDLLSLSPPNITKVVDHCEKMGLVVRTDHGTDRRVKVIKLTPQGEKLEGQVSQVHGLRIENMLAEVTEAELDELVRILRKVRHGLKKSGWLATKNGTNIASLAVKAPASKPGRASHGFPNGLREPDSP